MPNRQPPETHLIETLVRLDPSLRELASGSWDEEGGYLAYVFFGDLAVRFADLLQDLPANAKLLEAITGAMEEALSGDEQLTNMVCVGFLEMLKARGVLAEASVFFGPKLKFWSDTI